MHSTSPFFNTNPEAVVAKWTPSSSPKHGPAKAHAIPELPIDILSLLDTRADKKCGTSQNFFYDCRKMSVPLSEEHGDSTKATSLNIAALIILCGTAGS